MLSSSSPALPSATKKQRRNVYLILSSSVDFVARTRRKRKHRVYRLRLRGGIMAVMQRSEGENGYATRNVKVHCYGKLDTSFLRFVFNAIQLQNQTR